MSLAALGHDWRTPSSERDDLPTTAPKSVVPVNGIALPGAVASFVRVSDTRVTKHKSKDCTSFGAKLSWTAPAHAVGRLPGI